MTTSTIQSINGHEAIAVAIEHLETRFMRFEDEVLDNRDIMTGLSNAQNRTEATLAILAGQLKQVTNRPSQTGALVTAVGVAVSIMALALTPIAWLAVNNSTRHNEAQERELLTARELGAVDARLDLGEIRDAQMYDMHKTLSESVRLIEREHRE